MRIDSMTGIARGGDIVCHAIHIPHHTAEPAGPDTT
jgi:hypothetical protein